MSHPREVPICGRWRLTERDKHQVGGQGVTCPVGGWGAARLEGGSFQPPLWSAMQPAVKVTPRPALFHTVPAANPWRYFLSPHKSEARGALRWQDRRSRSLANRPGRSAGARVAGGAAGQL